MLTLNQVEYKKNICLVLCLVFLSSVLYAGNTMDSELKRDDLVVYEIMDETIDLLTSKYPLEPFGTGINGKFEYLELSFQTSENLDQEKAREILMDCVEIFLDKINSNKKIQEFLIKKPFTFENAGVVIYIRDKNNRSVFHPSISVARCSSYGLAYKSVDKENIYGYKEVKEESHEEALAKLGRGKPSQGEAKK